MSKKEKQAKLPEGYFILEGGFLFCPSAYSKKPLVVNLNKIDCIVTSEEYHGYNNNGGKVTPNLLSPSNPLFGIVKATDLVLYIQGGKTVEIAWEASLQDFLDNVLANLPQATPSTLEVTS